MSSCSWEGARTQNSLTGVTEGDTYGNTTSIETVVCVSVGLL